MHRLSDLKEFLARSGAAPKKSLSQNFLIDQNILDKISGLGIDTEASLFVEIGPGPGALTEKLLATGKPVIAIELDRVFAKELQRLDPEGKQLIVIEGDVLEVDIEALLRAHLKEGEKAAVVANLPYQITSRILTEFAKKEEFISHLIVMIQKEVADRIKSKPGGKTYGSLTVYLNYHSYFDEGFTVSRNCFYPKPNVDSAVIKLALRPPPKVSDEEKFFQLTRQAFQQRRKTLRKSLSELYSKELITESLVEMGLSEDSRPEVLTLENFIYLFERMNQ